MAYIREGTLEDRRGRRGRTDKLGKFINFLTILCSLLAILAIFLIANASSGMDGMISNFASTTFDKAKAGVIGNYNMKWMYRFLIDLIVIICLSALGLYLNSKRLKRKRDNYYVSLVALFGLSSLISLIVLFGLIF